MLPVPTTHSPLVRFMSPACSFCLGLPYVAWLAALQRQRVMVKHGLPPSDEDGMATACFPCSLMQMHALLQQQHHGHTGQHQQQQWPVSAPLRAPRVQQMSGEGEGLQMLCMCVCLCLCVMLATCRTTLAGSRVPVAKFVTHAVLSLTHVLLPCLCCDCCCCSCCI